MVRTANSLIFGLLNKYLQVTDPICVSRGKNIIEQGDILMTPKSSMYMPVALLAKPCSFALLTGILKLEQVD